MEKPTIQNVYVLTLKNRSTYCGEYDSSEDYILRVIAESMVELKEKAVVPLLSMGQIESWNLYMGDLVFYNGEYLVPLQDNSCHDTYTVEIMLTSISKSYPQLLREIYASDLFLTTAQKMKEESAAEEERKSAEEKEAEVERKRAEYLRLKAEFEGDSSLTK